MKIRVRFDAFDLREALFVAAVESMPPDASHTDEQTLIPGREDRFRELLAPWIDSSGQESGRGRIVVEFDLEAGTARVERRDGKGDEERQAVAELLVTIQNYRQGADWFEDLEHSANAAARAIGEPEFAAGWWREEKGRHQWVLCKMCRDGLGAPSDHAPCFGCGDMVFDVDDPAAKP